MNAICITGRLCSHPELKTTTSGVSVCAVNVAVDRDYKQNGEKVCDFIPCVFWRGTAEFVSKYFGKGDGIAVTGSLESRRYTDKNGNNRIVWEVKADKVNFCGSKKSNSDNQITAPEYKADIDEIISDDDSPF